MTEKSNLDKYTVILLAGNGIYPNKLWLEKLSTELKTVFKNIIKHIYTHWETGESLINLDKELQKSKKNIVSLDINNYIIIAKSAGVLLSLKGIYERIISPTICVFLGTPISWAYQNGFDIDLWLEKYKVPTLFIQEKEDPITTYKELNTYLKSKKTENYSMQQIEGNTHNYDNFSIIIKLVKSFTKEGGVTDMFERDIDSDMFKPLVGALLIKEEAHEKHLVVEKKQVQAKNEGVKEVVKIEDATQA